MCVSGGGSPRATSGLQTPLYERTQCQEVYIPGTVSVPVRGPSARLPLSGRCPSQRCSSRTRRRGEARGTGGLFGQTRCGGSNSRGDWVPSTWSGLGRYIIRQLELGSGVRVRGAGAPGLGIRSLPSRSATTCEEDCQTTQHIKPQEAFVAFSCPRPHKTQGGTPGSPNENEDGASGRVAEDECKYVSIHMPQRADTRGGSTHTQCITQSLTHMMPTAATMARGLRRLVRCPQQADLYSHRGVTQSTRGSTPRPGMRGGIVLRHPAPPSRTRGARPRLGTRHTLIQIRTG